MSQRTGERLRRRALFTAGLGVALGGCHEVAAGGEPRAPSGAQLSRRLHPNEVLPADLDVVVRLDVQALRRTLGPTFDQQLASRFSSDPILARAAPRARTLTVALRAADIERGDHVIVLEGDPGDLGLANEGYEAQPSANDKVRVFVRALPGPRDGTEAVVILDERAVVLVSPVETDAVLRVLRDGPDEQRGQPVAEGIVSADIRARRLPHELERRFPSFGRLIAQVTRIKALMAAGDEGLRVETEIIARGDAGAERVRKFLDVLREGASEDGATVVLRRMKIEKLGATVRVTAALPIDVLVALLEPRADGERPRPAM